ncbi:hypothetical protein QJS04_geneDACA012476 [Acorus gramineus]|uniref:Uncharacterized protein n=1 Tax=Acorus gramineus TaxID=55184 RepID=A0AAV9BD87_ACOGR|nr:hypothetical protein QJS04_geneDACA012476 [Acorus gramineus]
MSTLITSSTTTTKPKPHHHHHHHHKEVSRTINLFTFHTLERNLYNHLVHRMNRNPERVKSVISLWLWLESIGHVGLVRHINSLPTNHSISAFVSEADSILDTILDHHPHHPSTGDALPELSRLVREPLDLRFFRFHRDVAARGVARAYKNVCAVIFNEVVKRAAARDRNHPMNRIVSPAAAASAPPTFPTATAATTVGSTLNPNANPWVPAEQRSVFVAFARGRPLTEEEVVEFFTLRFGECVESLSIEQTAAGMVPMFGQVRFVSLSMIDIVMNGQQAAKFVVNGKHMWARMLVPLSV